MAATFAPRELKRINALRLQGILDTPPEETFDAITRAAAAICETPIALIPFVDENRHWFKSAFGVDLSEGPRESALCSQAILTPDELLEIEDASLDPRFRDNKLVKGAPNIRFYAGMPLTPNGHALGTLCVIDTKPRVLTDSQRAALRELAGVVSSLLEARASTSAIALAIEKNADHGALVTDARLTGYPVVYANHGYEKLTQYSRSEIIGNACPVLHGQDSDINTVAQLEKAIAAKQECVATLECYRKDGTSFWNEITITPVRDDKDETTHFLHINRDVSDKHATKHQLEESCELLERRVEQRTVELRDSEERYRELFENADDLIQCVDMDGKFIYVNPAWHETTGYTAAELEELTLFDLVHPDSLEACRECLRRSAAGDQVGTVETTFVARNGEQIKVVGSVNCQFKDGKPIAARGIFRNITARVAVADSLERARTDAENVADSQSKFLAAASHDLRQPLAAVGIYLAVLEKQLVDPKDIEVSGHIRQSLGATRELLDALLDISSLRSGSVQPHVVDFSLGTIFDELRSTNECFANEKQLALHFEQPECGIRSDPALLKRILENLIANAIHYTETGRVDVRCQVNDDYVRIEVSDTGIGIPAEHMEHIYAEYFQLNNDVRDRRNGLGFGLAIVKHIARLLEHRVTATSTPGEGSSFVVEVPRSTVSVEPTRTIRFPNGESLRLLLVEDNPAILAATNMLFRLAGHTVVSAADGNEALTHLASGIQPDLFVSDYRLPGMNGVQLAKRVRQSVGYELPVVLITGDTSITTTDLDNCQVLHKPVDSKKLLSILQTAGKTSK